MKRILTIIVFIILFIAGAVIMLRLSSGSEDEWRCVNGEWVKHGVPADPNPPERDCS